MHFQIFLPGTKKLTDADVGLADFVRGAEQLPGQTGPEGLTGSLVCWRKPLETHAQALGYHPEKQTWAAAIPQPKRNLAAGRYWIGFWNNSPPLPADLRRETTFEGREVKLGDGRRWEIPAAARLPRVVRFDRTSGDVSFDAVRAEFALFWDESLDYFNAMMNASVTSDKFTVSADWVHYILRALRLNYRITAEVVDEFGLLDHPQCIECVYSTIQYHEIAEVQAWLAKKKATPADVDRMTAELETRLDSLSTSPGETGS